MSAGQKEKEESSSIIIVQNESDDVSCWQDLLFHTFSPFSGEAPLVSLLVSNAISSIFSFNSFTKKKHVRLHRPLARDTFSGMWERELVEHWRESTTYRDGWKKKEGKGRRRRNKEANDRLNDCPAAGVIACCSVPGESNHSVLFSSCPSLSLRNVSLTIPPLSNNLHALYTTDSQTIFPFLFFSCRLGQWNTSRWPINSHAEPKRRREPNYLSDDNFLLLIANAPADWRRPVTHLGGSSAVYPNTCMLAMYLITHFVFVFPFNTTAAAGGY